MFTSARARRTEALIVILPLRSGTEFISHLLLLHVEYDESCPSAKGKKSWVTGTMTSKTW